MNERYGTEVYTARNVSDKFRYLVGLYYEQSACMRTGAPFTKKFEFYDMCDATLGE